MTLQTRQKNKTIHILPHISRSKGNREMKFGQLIEYDVRNVFLKNHDEKQAGRLVLDLFLLFFKKKLYIKSKQVVSTLVLIIFIRNGKIFWKQGPST